MGIVLLLPITAVPGLIAFMTARRRGNSPAAAVLLLAGACLIGFGFAALNATFSPAGDSTRPALFGAITIFVTALSVATSGLTWLALGRYTSRNPA